MLLVLYRKPISFSQLVFELIFLHCPVKLKLGLQNVHRRKIKVDQKQIRPLVFVNLVIYFKIKYNFSGISIFNSGVSVYGVKQSLTSLEILH